MSTRVRELKREIRRLSEDEQDPSVRDFFAKLFKLRNDEIFESLLERVLEGRQRVSGTHLLYLLYVSLQYITGFSYDVPKPKEQLKADLHKHHDHLVELCREKNVSMNVVERYFHLQLILEIIQEPVTIADLGSSLGIGLASLNSDWFTSIEIDPRLHEIWNNEIQIERAYGIDVEEPDLAWAKACYFPENKKYRDNLDAYRRVFQNNPQFEFVHGDLMNLQDLDVPKFDVVWMSNVLYQIEADHDQVKKVIRSALVADGTWINANYRHHDEDFKRNRNPYVSEVREKRDWSNSMEVLESPSDRVESVQPGQNFQIFVDKHSSSS